MPEPQKIEYHQLSANFEFPSNSFCLDTATVTNYLKAVDDTSPFFANSELIPPLVIAAHALAALSRGMSLPPGSIHVSQELEFTGTARVNDTLTSHARVTRKQDRGKIRLLAIDLNVMNQDHETVLTGKTSFILPATNEER